MSRPGALKGPAGFRGRRETGTFGRASQGEGVNESVQDRVESFDRGESRKERFWGRVESGGLLNIAIIV